MGLELKEVPKLALLIGLLGLSGYITVWIAGKIRDEISKTAED